MARCIVCGRKLTNKDSIARGIGKECILNKGKPIKGWNHRVINSAKIMHGEHFYVGSKEITKDNFEGLKDWLVRYGFIIKDGDVSEEMLDRVYFNPEILGTGDLNGKEKK